MQNAWTQNTSCISARVACIFLYTLTLFALVSEQDARSRRSGGSAARRRCSRRALARSAVGQNCRDPEARPEAAARGSFEAHPRLGTRLKDASALLADTLAPRCSHGAPLRQPHDDFQPRGAPLSGRICHGGHLQRRSGRGDPFQGRSCAGCREAHHFQGASLADLFPSPIRSQQHSNRICRLCWVLSFCPFVGALSQPPMSLGCTEIWSAIFVSLSVQSRGYRNWLPACSGRTPQLQATCSVKAALYTGNLPS